MYFLQSPVVRDLEVFSRMPERWRRSGERSDWADANKAGQPTDSFIEGPVFDGAGNLYVTDIPFGRIFRIDAAGRPVEFRFSVRPDFVDPMEYVFTRE